MAPTFDTMTADAVAALFAGAAQAMRHQNNSGFAPPAVGGPVDRKYRTVDGYREAAAKLWGQSNTAGQR